MSDHTPNTEEVRTQWAGFQFASKYGERSRLLRAAKFDAWLATVKAEAWAEGADFQWDRLSDERATNDPARNPYRSET